MDPFLDPTNELYNPMAAKIAADNAAVMSEPVKEKGRGLFGNIIDGIKAKKEEKENAAQALADNSMVRDAWMPKDIDIRTQPTPFEVEALATGGTMAVGGAGEARANAADVGKRTGADEAEQKRLGEERLANAIKQAEKLRLERMEDISGSALIGEIGKREAETGVKPNLADPLVRTDISRELWDMNDAKDVAVEADAVSAASPNVGGNPPPKVVEKPAPSKPEEDVLPAPSTEEAQKEEAVNINVPGHDPGGEMSNEVNEVLDTSTDKNDFMNKAKELMDKWGVPILTILQAYMYGASGMKDETMFEKKDRLEEEAASKAFEEKLIKEGQTYEQEQARIQRDFEARELDRQMAFQKQLQELAGTQKLSEIAATGNLEKEIAQIKENNPSAAGMSDMEIMQLLLQNAGQFGYDVPQPAGGQ